MIKGPLVITLTLLLTATSAFCGHSFNLSKPAVSAPPVVIYKTHTDYSKYVPVILSDDRTKVVSYPDIKDIYFEGKLAYPTALTCGYWLDNRGIGPHVAFIKLTYDDYAKLPATPSAIDLFAMLLDANPLCTMYQLGNRRDYKDPVAEINHIIKKHELKKYKRLK